MFKNPVVGLLITAFLVPFLNGHCQERDTASNTLKYFNKTELGVSFGIGSYPNNIYNGVTYKLKNDEIVATLQTVNGVMYNNRWLLGVSVGVEKWRYGLFWPVYGYLGYNFKRTDNTFFANIYLGYGIGTRYSHGGGEYDRSSVAEGKGAFALMIGVGYKMKVSKSIKFGYEIFYKYQALNTSYQNIYQKNDSIPPVSSTVNYKLGLHFAGFKLAIFFP
ncbi:MAG: hypothetical protein NTW31_11760 [Bacteroidetes bacterium]|nr:hypothetical protein [Bacteroidota bacterium]